MAYVAFPDLGGAARKSVSPAPQPDAMSAPVEPLSALEWSVVALARKDRLGTLRAESRLVSVLRILSKSPNPVLADPRLEALRRIAVLTWHYGYSIAGHEVTAFLAAGFTAGQYESMADSINATKRRGAGPPAADQRRPRAAVLAGAAGFTA